MGISRTLKDFACALLGEYDEQKLIKKIREGGDRSVVSAAMADGIDDEATLRRALKIATECGNKDAALAITEYLPEKPRTGARTVTAREFFNPK
jgi:hypothetical protein